MSAPFVYRSHDPEVLSAWKMTNEAMRVYIRQSQAVLDEAGFGAYKVYRATAGIRPYKFAGLAIPDGEKPPAGWRMTEQFAVPDKRTKAGKQIDAALNAIRHPGDPLLKLIGMPPDVMTSSGRFTSPAVRLLEDGNALYTAWRVDPAGCRESLMAGKFEIDYGRWESVPLSAYYAEVERADAAEVTA